MHASIAAVRMIPTDQGLTPVVLLAPDENGTDRPATDDVDAVLPIFIGFEEAVSIVRGLDAVDIGRPLTHDLMLDAVEELGGRIDRVVVNDVHEGTYIATLHLATPRGEAVIDSRPSDSLALAARTGVSIEIEQEVFEDGQRPRTDFADADDIREVVSL